MKTIAKKILPNSLIPLAGKAYSKFSYRKTPLATHYSGDNTSVLQCSIAYNKFGGYCIPLSSHYRPAAQKILSGNVNEEETIEYIVNNCSEGDIIHAGTYFGDFLPALSAACADSSRVWAFEPNPENYRCALITQQINEINNVELANMGLGSNEGLLPMMVSDENGRALGGASRFIETAHNTNVQQLTQVKIVRIDDIVPSDRRVTIIQLDVERFEQPALAGAMSTIKRNRPILILEHLPDRVWLAENILELGYIVVGKVCRNTILRAD